MADLREVMELNKRAIDLSPDDSSRFGGLCNMAQSRLVAWDYDGEMTHIKSAIGLLREAVGIGESIPNTLDYVLALNALSEAIQSQLHLSEQDIDECVSLDTLALTYIPKGHRERPLALAALATTILVHYTISFQSDDFALYHTLHEELRSMLDAGFQDTDILADYWAFAQNIGPYHSDRFALTSIFRQRTYILRAEYQPEQNDIILSFAARRLAPGVFLRRLIDPIGQERELMSSFALLQRATSDDERKSVRGSIAWHCRGKGIKDSNNFLPLTGRLEDIEQEWLAFMPVQDSHPWASAFYFQFSIILVDLVEEYGLEAIQWAQKYAHRAWDVHQSQVPWGFQILSHIAVLYIMQAEAECESSEDGTTAMQALNQVIRYTDIASTMCPPSLLHEEVQIYVVDVCIMKHRLMSRDSPHLSSAIEICRERCIDRGMDAWKRYDFAERFVDIAKEFEVHLLEALLIQVDIIYDIVSTQLSMPEAVMRIDHLELSNALETAAEHCFTVGVHESALRVLEKGRGMLWARLVQLQAHTLKGTNQSANDVAQLELILEAAAEERGKVTERGNMPWKRMLNLASRERRLSMDIQRLMERVQDGPRLRGEDARPFMSTVLSGVSPVVVLFAGVYRCDALVITGPDYAIQHVALPECDRETLDQLVEKARSALKDEGLLRRSMRFAVRLNESWDTLQDTFEDVLTDTWNVIVEPILRALQIKPSSCPPRLWWYPTGPFRQLPLHAAGVYRSEDYDDCAPSVLDYVVSSYLPPFSVASTLPNSVQPKTPHILAVYQSALNTGAPLFNVEPEVRKIAEIAKDRGIPVTVLGEHHATVNSISSALSDATIVHFALHGQQHAEAPMESSLLLDNGTELKLSQLMELNLPNAELVFLSACQTATGDKNVSEEVIHIAAAMLFVGFRSAIGTMWSINDEDGPEVAGETYRYLLGDAMNPAYALHESVKILRDQHGVPAIRWAPFVHIGI
ncbi:hypothetical protein BDZ89DRAFT_781717 [Hymenopellis radicata]|nr:hypothetical protein BDZ89DRAFT_781717 [Hymenopellis radicata]